MKKKIISEYSSETGTSFSIVVKKKLFYKKTKYQEIEIYKSEKLGNVLLLNKCFMFTEKDHHFYHDKCNELMSKKGPLKNVLVVGGGDFALAKTLSSRKNIKSVTIIEIDKEVTSACKIFFPIFFEINQHFFKKIKLVHVDGFEWVKNNDSKKFDVIIVDSTDPTGCAKKLFTKRFYRYIFKILNSDGV